MPEHPKHMALRPLESAEAKALENATLSVAQFCAENEEEIRRALYRDDELQASHDFANVMRQWNRATEAFLALVDKANREALGIEPGSATIRK